MVHMVQYAGWKVPVDRDHTPCHRSGHTHAAHAQEQNLEKKQFTKFSSFSGNLELVLYCTDVMPQAHIKDIPS